MCYIYALPGKVMCCLDFVFCLLNLSPSRDSIQDLAYKNIAEHEVLTEWAEHRSSAAEG